MKRAYNIYSFKFDEVQPQQRLFVSWGLLLLLALIWGSSFILMKRALVSFNPFQVGAFREMVAFVALIPFVIRKKFKLSTISSKGWLGLAIVGMTGNGIPAFLFPYAETQLSSASVGILNAMTPIFVLLIGGLLFGLVFTRRKVLGVLLGLVGSVFLILLGGEDIDITAKLTYAALVLLATICYGISANVLKNLLNTEPIDSITISGIAIGIASVPYLIYFLSSETYLLFNNPTAWISFGYASILAVLGTAFAQVMFNHLMKMTDPVFSTSVTYLIPIVALVWGLIDGEPLTLGQVGCMGVILGGVYLVNKK